MPRIIDTHAHPQTKPFNSDRDEVLDRARAAGVETLIVVGYDAESSRGALALAGQHRDIWATAGIHPHDAAQAGDDDWSLLATMTGEPLIVALGEMGLDFFRNLSPHDVQRAVLQRQLELAGRHDLPVVIHSRDAEQATWEILESWARSRRLAGGTEPFGVMHCYAYGVAAAARYVDIGFMISVPGTVTYSNNIRGQEVAAAVDAGAIVLETDCPYLTPQFKRGKRNEPAYIVETLKYVARLRRITSDELGDMTTANARRLFRLDSRSRR